MNIAMIVRRFTTNGGTEKYVYDLSNWLVSRGHEVHIYCHDIESGLETASGIEFHKLKVIPRVGVLRALTLWWSAERVDLRNHDLVQGFGRTTNHHLYRAGGGVHRAAIDALFNTWFQRLLPYLSFAERLTLWVDKTAFSRAKVVICNSKMVARQASAWYGIPPCDLEVVRNGVDPDRFKPNPALREKVRREWGVPSGGKVALFLGNGFRRKGLLVAAQAFAKVAAPMDRFVVAGGRDTSAARHLKPIESALGDRLVSLGKVKAPERCFVGADVTVMPTLYDAAANTTVESMACGVSTVTSVFDGNAELAPDPRLVVHDPRSVDEVAAALSFGWENSAKMGALSREIALQWPVGRNGERMETIYQELISGQR